MTKEEAYRRWYNKGAGIELQPDVNGDELVYTGENLTLFYAEFILLSSMLGDISSDDQQVCARLLNTIRVSDRPGAYHRDLKSSNDYDSGIQPNSMSHDNLLGIVILMDILNLDVQKDEMRRRLYTSFGTYSNTRGFDYPFNPGFYATFCAILGGFIPSLISLLCLPIFIINFIITNLKDKSNTSSRLLYFIELYTLRKHLIFGPVFWIYKKLLKKTYNSENPLEEMCKIYYRNENHPIRDLCSKVKDKY